MNTILITGAEGFIGRNLVSHLRRRDDVQVHEYDLGGTEADLRRGAAEANVVFHLAGVNRPQDPAEFEVGNAGFTAHLCRILAELQRTPHLVASSSVQATQDNPYGVSKRHGEEILIRFARDAGARVAIYRLKNVFGKWCRPNYNSVVATYCHNIAHDLPIQINEPGRILELAYVDDVIAAFLKEIDVPSRPENSLVSPDAIPSYSLTLGDLAARINAFHEMQLSLRLPDFSIRFNQQLYATYLSCVAPERWEYALDVKQDARGSLAEFMKSSSFGQVFVSRTRPGITRGNHYHHTKTEKFLVVAGEGLVRFRQVDGTEIHEFRVRGEDYHVLDIPPGFTHSITNVGTDEMITLFWASETFDTDRPDTCFQPVELREVQ